MFLQSQYYPIDESRVGLVETMLIEQALSWFAPLFGKRSLILNNLATFAKTFGEHNKNHWTTSEPKSIYYNKDCDLH